MQFPEDLYIYLEIINHLRLQDEKWTSINYVLIYMFKILLFGISRHFYVYFNVKQFLKQNSFFKKNQKSLVLLFLSKSHLLHIHFTGASFWFLFLVSSMLKQLFHHDGKVYGGSEHSVHFPLIKPIAVVSFFDALSYTRLQQNLPHYENGAFGKVCDLPFWGLAAQRMLKCARGGSNHHCCVTWTK